MFFLMMMVIKGKMDPTTGSFLFLFLAGFLQIRAGASAG